MDKCTTFNWMWWQEVQLTCTSAQWPQHIHAKLRDCHTSCKHCFTTWYRNRRQGLEVVNICSKVSKFHLYPLPLIILRLVSHVYNTYTESVTCFSDTYLLLPNHYFKTEHTFHFRTECIFIPCHTFQSQSNHAQLSFKLHNNIDPPQKFASEPIYLVLNSSINLEILAIPSATIYFSMEVLHL
jgi:hypothetical protein